MVQSETQKDITYVVGKDKGKFIIDILKTFAIEISDLHLFLSSSKTYIKSANLAFDLERSTKPS